MIWKASRRISSDNHFGLRRNPGAGYVGASHTNLDAPRVFLLHGYLNRYRDVCLATF